MSTITLDETESCCVREGSLVKWPQYPAVEYGAFSCLETNSPRNETKISSSTSMNLPVGLLQFGRCQVEASVCIRGLGEAEFNRNPE